jgi:glycosyltransferase involved in cell wall biosynthesis
VQQKKVKIIFISASDVSHDSRILKQIRVAKEAGYQILVLGVKDSSKNHLNLESNFKLVTPYFRLLSQNKLKEKGIPLTRVVLFCLTMLEVFIKFSYHALKFRPHIIHCSDYFPLPVAVFFKILSRAKLIYDAHELESQTNSITKLTSLYVYGLERLLWPFIDTTFYVSNSIREWYNLKIGFKKSELVLNAPTGKMLNRKTTYFRDTFNIADGINIYLYLGMLGRGRGIDLALKVFSDSQNKNAIIFMGYGEKEKIIKSYSVKHNNIFLHPPVPHDEVVGLASSADFGYCMLENVSLSDYFCLPNKMFEYAFSGLPVIASNFPDISVAVDEFNLGVVAELNEKSINEGITKLASGKLNNEYLNQDLFPLSWEFQAEKVAKIFNELIEK